jgi:hypothetical protein
MNIPEDQLKSTKKALHHLIDERTSAPWATYDEDDLSTDEQDHEDVDQIETVLDVLKFLRDQGSRTVFVEWASCLDPLNRFEVEGKEYPDEEDEFSFRKYLMKTYGISKKEFPSD